MYAVDCIIIFNVHHFIQMESFPNKFNIIIKSLNKICFNCKKNVHAMIIYYHKPISRSLWQSTTFFSFPLKTNVGFLILSQIFGKSSNLNSSHSVKIHWKFEKQMRYVLHCRFQCYFWKTITLALKKFCLILESVPTAWETWLTFASVALQSADIALTNEILWE